MVYLIEEENVRYIQTLSDRIDSSQIYAKDDGVLL